MPPKRVAIQPARRTQPQGYLGSIYHTLTSEENASVVLSVAMFGVCTNFAPGMLYQVQHEHEHKSPFRMSD
ncbi:hypothetical protein PV05_07054 [Exophiala xenobiotica]|uniref:Uncharacterized protein n=1 Tax=Exophiala xenobiotica TaxID=348802 RepID=A0A0D2EJ55_9EURO|nr:uncharacterized protein PV05_07054 [Exophiala xenobiotica]KIW54710.1 hypothetical protein PV05_07054 [Exophiala xenobiotica]